MGPRGNFGRLLWSNGISGFGTQITIVALPLTAVATLHASPFQLGLLSAVQTAAFLLIGLPAGVWVDRLRRRPILVRADLVRGVALLTVPAAAWLGVLTLPHLYAVAFVLGVGTVFADVAHMSFVPAVVPEERLERANGRLEVTRQVSVLAGPGVGGWLVSTLTAPVALLADAAGYLVSARLLSGVRVAERPRPPEGRRLWAEVRAGLAFVLGEPVLSRVALGGALTRIALGICAVGYPLYLFVGLEVGATVYGLLLSASAVGALAGAAVVARVTLRYGVGTTLYGSAVLVVALQLPAVATGPGWRLLIFPVSSALAAAAGVVFNVAQLSYRQRITPEHLLGRVNASMRFLMWGTTPVGGLAGGLLGEWLGGYGVFAAGVALLGLSYLAIVTAPSIRRAGAAAR
ncbi:MFS transporter [Nonomuraea gerenzanensis]|uniref:Major facilitator superfamily MFS_1 n=1 Tax=Nonomuraea gerenzanensis TaxID=93944 RepID=A0A1M4ENK1_9ACTN|nr:MFS transporter [Nonomuraea gerenzanensis]UBU11896.1 MFS transporter [Nonomuraea gerenzanensis]SBP00408.1 major facilitator superfamily MFS_1 [Nonomuraea gerenzanensis]